MMKRADMGDYPVAALLLWGAGAWDTGVRPLSHQPQACLGTGV